MAKRHPSWPSVTPDPAISKRRMAAHKACGCPICIHVIKFDNLTTKEHRAAMKHPFNECQVMNPNYVKPNQAGNS